MSEMVVIQERCRFLSTKGMFVDTGQDPFASLSAQFWCSLTQTCLGPDGQLCDDQQCTPGRNCYDGV